MECVLVVDDDVELCDLIKEFLELEGFQVDAVHNGQEGLNAALSGAYSLVILDIMLPELNGLDVLRQIRTRSQLPVLLLSARGNEAERVVGLELGGDDYLPKPCSTRELLARIRAILRRTHWDATRLPARIRIGDLELDTTHRTVTQGDSSLDFTPIEFQILELLLRSAGKVVRREQLAQAALHRSLDPFDRSLDVHISNIRKKLGTHPGAADVIQTMRGVGYVYQAPSERV